MVQEPDHRSLGVEHGLVHVDVDDLGAGFDLLARHGHRGLEFAAQDEAGEGLGTGDIGALADIDEQAGRRRYCWAPGRTGAELFRAATECARCNASGGRLCDPAMCSGVVPQQPPAMLMMPARLFVDRRCQHRRRSRQPPRALGKPALGCAETKHRPPATARRYLGATRLRPEHSSARPTAGLCAATEFQNASRGLSRQRPARGIGDGPGKIMTGKRRACFVEELFGLRTMPPWRLRCRTPFRPAMTSAPPSA